MLKCVGLYLWGTGCSNQSTICISSRRTSDHGVEASTISGRIGVHSGASRGELQAIILLVNFDADRGEVHSSCRTRQIERWNLEQILINLEVYEMLPVLKEVRLRDFQVIWLA